MSLELDIPIAPMREKTKKKSRGKFTQITEKISLTLPTVGAKESTVQVRETRSNTPLHIALPLTGRLADLKPGETVHFAYQSAQAWCFAA